MDVQQDFLQRNGERSAAMRRDRDEIVSRISHQIAAIQRQAPYTIDCVQQLRRAIKQGQSNLFAFRALLKSKPPTVLDTIDLNRR